MTVADKKSHTPSATFADAVGRLNRANIDFFQTRTLSSVDHKHAREAALADALGAMAEDFGVKLQRPLQINSRGEFAIVALNADGSDPSRSVKATNQFGAFADHLNPHNPRTGTQPGAHMIPENGWCYINHFEIERMVLSFAAGLDIDPPAPKVPEFDSRTIARQSASRIKPARRI